MPEVSERTKLEQELGAKLAKENAAAVEKAELDRLAEQGPPDGPGPQATQMCCSEPSEIEQDMAAATAEAEAQAIAQGRPAKEPVFPLAKEPYQPKPPRNGKANSGG